ncbi:biotin/lipoyl-containing protein [Spongiivirga citrea]|uniref:Acetyl-CoA carboxylase biotin carboxyl carrier protein subunit n=1 Tax=Spongiivirga citrea TaxID=1481457 RepID=A0A6M0CHL3_9FLAO|nr:acetyl-CoA carboxylase biotin carboxyl carrier protein subunit [Spongiivirga citrea]NER17438.1 acetyl-CoA carboxylase biotin carboxyl carrier protein subunit [Spongiivirga citrea]
MASDLFQLHINNKQSIDLNTSDIKELNLIKTAENTYHLIDGDASYTIEVVASDYNSRSYTLKINGQLQEVSIKNSLDLLIDKMGLTASTTKDVNVVNAPMPGQIISVEIKEGQEVDENDPILILEAMKMENVMLAPKSGVIKNIHVDTAQVVEKGQLLVEFE